MADLDEGYRLNSDDNKTNAEKEDKSALEDCQENWLPKKQKLIIQNRSNFQIAFVLL
jgi:hypothetical protein